LAGIVPSSETIQRAASLKIHLAGTPGLTDQGNSVIFPKKIRSSELLSMRNSSGTKSASGQAATPESAVPPNILGRRTARGNIIKEVGVLELIIIILVVLWALGFFAFHVGGGLIHALIVIALIILIVRLLRGRRVL
jgi:hypothetical protein